MYLAKNTQPNKKTSLPKQTEEQHNLLEPRMLYTWIRSLLLLICNRIEAKKSAISASQLIASATKVAQTLNLAH
jgi:hypothetical protein